MRNNIASFRIPDWRTRSSDLRRGAIPVGIAARALHCRSADPSVGRLYPISVPPSEELTRRGRREGVQRVVNPVWRPTPAMKQRNPEWPDEVAGRSPDNPPGGRALCLSPTCCRSQGTHDVRKIGRRSPNGGLGLHSARVPELFAMAEFGTQVLPI